MFAIFFWILAFLWLIGIFVPDTASPYVVRGRSLIILVMLILLGLKVYPFSA
jgi:hypothetical protein